MHSLLTNPPVVDQLYSEIEIEQQRSLRVSLNAENYRIGVYFGAKLVGFTRAFQTEGDNLHMALSAVHPDHQRRGIYSELVRSVVEFSKTRGYQTVDSYHRTTNNPVIIAKLRSGFVINGLTITDVMGCLVKLTYFHHPMRRKLMDARSGLSRPVAPLRDLFF